MIQIARRIPVLLLLFAGLLQPLAAAQGVTCVRNHGNAIVSGPAVGMTAIAPTAGEAGEHHHPSTSDSGDPQAPSASASCGTAAITSEVSAIFATTLARQDGARAVRIPTSLQLKYLFRPPRLS
ncbi:MAG TPA: hypothetical protein VFI91_04995 [Longimicrobiaceae bacterium]|nr:hypothetical protein [Longimicrobiaceae bacterium]